MTKMTECAGFYDTVVQIEEIIKVGGVIDVNTVGGSVGSHFYYFDSYDYDGHLESHQVYGKEELVNTLIKVYTEGGTIDKGTLGASGGRRDWIWFQAETPKVSEELQSELEAEIVSKTADEVLDTNPVEVDTLDVETPPEASEEVTEVKVEASPAAKKLAEANNINIVDVFNAIGQKKVNKPDVVKYLEE